MDEAAWQSRQLLEIESLSAIYFEESWIRHKAFEGKHLSKFDHDLTDLPNPGNHGFYSGNHPLLWPQDSG